MARLGVTIMSAIAAAVAATSCDAGRGGLFADDAPDAAPAAAPAGNEQQGLQLERKQK